MSWGGASATEEHRVLGRHGGQAARDARNSPHTSRVRRGALLASFLLASTPPKTMRGVELADSTLHTVSPRATLLPGGQCEEQSLDLVPTPWSGISIPLQARGHRRSRTPRAQCSSADPTEPKGWSAHPLRSSPTARKHPSSVKSLKSQATPSGGRSQKGKGNITRFRQGWKKELGG